MYGMSRSRSTSATMSLPNPDALAPDGMGRSTADVSSLLTSTCRVSGGNASRVDMKRLSMGVGLDSPVARTAGAGDLHPGYEALQSKPITRPDATAPAPRR